MKHIPILVLILTAFVSSHPLGAQTEELSQVTIQATIPTYVLRAPRGNAELVATIEGGEEESAYGRDEDGDWLRIMDGWVLAEVFNTEGEIGALPDTTYSFVGISTAESNLYGGPSTKWFDKVGALHIGDYVLAIGRNEDSAWLKSPIGWLDAATVTNVGDISLLPVTPSGVIITAKTRTFILKEPELSAEFVHVFEAGEEALAIGRAGAWLQIVKGWVSSEALAVSGDISGLPFTGGGIVVTATLATGIRKWQSGRFIGIGRSLQTGESVIAVGRTASGNMLYTDQGWVPRRFVSSNDETMNLPVVAPESISATTTKSVIDVVPTASPPFGVDARAIRALIARHTDDIRILDFEAATSATTIEYDLKPWPFVPNESIANQVAFKIICAIRVGQQIPNTLKFIGHTHFKSEVGRKFTGPSVEMHISARNANRIVCAGNDPSDINWRSLASRYKSYPIPAGASVDYD